MKKEDSIPGFKYDEGKPQMGLLDRVALEEIAKVLTYGAKKYSKLNWRNGMDWSRCLDAALRHIAAWNDGEDNDRETGYSHLAHAACCLMFLMRYQKDGVGQDDRIATLLEDQGKGKPEYIGGPRTLTFTGNEIGAIPKGLDIKVDWNIKHAAVNAVLDSITSENSRTTTKQVDDSEVRPVDAHSKNCSCYYCTK